MGRTAEEALEAPLRKLLVPDGKGRMDQTIRRWPDAENWKKLQAWIVRRELGAAAATRKPFCKELENIFCDLYPLLRFTSLRD
jgi:hypothetical protein